MDTLCHFGLDSTPGGAFPARSFPSALGSASGRSLDLAGGGTRGVAIGGTVVGCSSTAAPMRSIAMRSTIATPISMAITAAMRRLTAATAACAGMAPAQGDPLPRVREAVGAPVPRQASEAAPLPPCDLEIAPSQALHDLAAPAPLAASAGAVTHGPFHLAATSAWAEVCEAAASMGKVAMVEAAAAKSRCRSEFYFVAGWR